MSTATFPIFDADNLPHFPFGDPSLGEQICYDCRTVWPCDAVCAMTVRLRVTTECVAGNDGHDGVQVVLFVEGQEFDGYLMGGYWWTSTDMREAFAIREDSVEIVGRAAVTV